MEENLLKPIKVDDFENLIVGVVSGGKIRIIHGQANYQREFMDSRWDQRTIIFDVDVPYVYILLKSYNWVKVFDYIVNEAGETLREYRLGNVGNDLEQSLEPENQ